MGPGHHPEQHQRVDRPQHPDPRTPLRVRPRETIEYHRHGNVAGGVDHFDPESDPGHGGAPQPRRGRLQGGRGGPVHGRLSPPLRRPEQPDWVMEQVQLLRGHHPGAVADDDDPPVFGVILHVDRGRRRDEREQDGDGCAPGQHLAWAGAPALSDRRQPGQHPDPAAGCGEQACRLHQGGRQPVVQVNERSPGADRRHHGPVSGRAQRREYGDAERRHEQRHRGGALRRESGGRRLPATERGGRGHPVIITKTTGIITFFATSGQRSVGRGGRSSQGAALATRPPTPGRGRPRERTARAPRPGGRSSGRTGRSAP